MRFLRKLFPYLPATRRQVGELKFLILNAQELMMASKEILAAKLTEVGDLVTKIGAETSGLVTQVADLKAQLENAGVDQALIDQADAILGRAKAVDDLVPDTVPTPESPNPESPETPETPAEGSTDEGTARA